MFTVARLKCITAPHASDWKSAVPSNRQLTLTDTHFRIAVKMNLGLGLDLPKDCHSCHGINKVQVDPYHYLSCSHHKRREITIRHNLVLCVLSTMINHVSGLAVREPANLHDKDGRTPDLQLILRSIHALCDVRISNPLCPTHLQKATEECLSVAAAGEQLKTNKYQ